MFIRFDHKNIYKARLPTVQVYHWRMKNIQSYMYVQPKNKRYLQYNNQALIKTYEQKHVNGKVEYAYGSTIYIYEFQEFKHSKKLKQNGPKNSIVKLLIWYQREVLLQSTTMAFTNHVRPIIKNKYQANGFRINNQYITYINHSSSKTKLCRNFTAEN